MSGSADLLSRLAVVTVALSSLAALGRADQPQERLTCHEVAQRELKPLLDAVANAKLAEEQYRESNLEWCNIIRKKIADLHRVVRAGKQTEDENAVVAVSPQQRQSALKSIAEQEDNLRKARAREPKHYLPALGRSLTGPQLDKEIVEREQKLAKARASIAAGTYKLPLPTMGSRSYDRNGVKALIAKKKEEARKVITDWAAGNYRAFNPKTGRSTTNGAIERDIKNKEKELADYVALGDDAPAFAAGANRTARAIKEQMTRAFAKEDSEQVAAMQKLLAEWQKSKDVRIEELRKQIARLQECLEAHKQVKKDDLAEREKYIRETLMRALDETPCGDGTKLNPRVDTINKHRQRLSGTSESDAERERRLARYDDKVYVDPDGNVHGNEMEGLKNATRDDKIATPQKKSMTWPEFVEWLENHADILGGYDELKGMRDATALFDDFIHLAGNLDLNKRGTKKFRQRMRNLREMLDKINDVFNDGILSTKRIRGLLDGLKKTTRKTAETRRHIEALQELLSASSSLRRQWSASSAINYIRAYAGPLTGVTGQYCTTSLSQLPGKLGQTWTKMGRFDQAMLGLNVLAAGANAYNRIEAGTPPAEAIFRSSVDLTIDLAIAGVPILAAAEMGTQILFGSYSVVTGDKAVADAALSSTIKHVAGTALDEVAHAAAFLGEASIALERAAYHEPNIAQILANVDFLRLRSCLSRVEDRLDALSPGHPDEAELLRMREAFRRLLRAKQQQG